MVNTAWNLTTIQLQLLHLIVFSTGNSFENVGREPSEGWGWYPLGGIFNARRVERKIFGVRKLGFKTSLLLFKVMRARGGGVLSLLVVGVKVCCTYL